MSQQPVDKRSPLATRQAIWQAVRALGKGGRSFTTSQVRAETICAKATVNEYLKGLALAGYLDGRSDPAAGSTVHYILGRKQSLEPPRVRKDGTEITQGQAQKNLWRTMKILGRFTAKELAIHARTETVNVAVSAAADYCKHLQHAGYLAIVEKAKNTGGKTIYAFIPSRNTGPKPPQIQKIKQVYDANTRTVVWSSGGQHEKP